MSYPYTQPIDGVYRPPVRGAPPAPAPAVTDAPGLTPGPRFSQWFGHSYIYREQPNPGGPAFAYEALGLMEFSPVGPGTVDRRWMRHWFGTTLFAALGRPIAGLGGLSAGQFVTQPLLVPAELDATGMETDPIGQYGGM